MDALTPAEIFSLRRAEQLVALSDLRAAQLWRADAATRPLPVVPSGLVTSTAAARAPR